MRARPDLDAVADRRGEFVGGALFTPQEVASDLDGLDIGCSQKVVRHVQTPDGPCGAIDTLVVAVAAGVA